ncbi:hypothetical protein CORC01_09451 [Colletotrichum orchidophilum]|uniref:Small ribosomal subunit protein mS35 mitochondrial conserved domain-containing protein n=1 Tax=Colletotrichum orchidophilum TaxID=1209926 RepID=A0A1G4B1S4_9PEZI|nr:uncharacterized protein CORC01_09451 [Colletotrichum orchidophilum]OHE95306.1 hypothetical protein CORC01_09451 [Colletotrichum orchidophilum]
MAAAGQAFRLCVRSSRRIPTTPRIAAPHPTTTTFAHRQIQRREFAASTTRRARNDEGNDALKFDEIYEPERETIEEMVERLKPEELQALEKVRKLDPEAQQMSVAQYLKKEMGRDEQEQEPILTSQEWKKVSSESRPVKSSFWYDEDDPTASTEGAMEEFDENDITPMAHGKLDEIREYRHYHRIMAWEMPLLSKLAKPFEPPKEGEVLRFRYTSYMGEYHPAEKKVVMQFSPADLGLTEVQADKLRKLVGPRYNPETDIVKMSSEKYEHQAQNKRYLSNLLDDLIASAKDPKDTFKDIPLDTRHHVFKNKPKFPKEWRMTEERRKELDGYRLRTLEIDAGKLEEGQVIDGTEKIEQFLAAPSPEAEGKVAEMVTVRGRGGNKSRGLPRR